MVLESVQTGRFEFGPYSLDPSSGELRKHGTRIKLQERPFRVLLMLLEVPGQVVSREELQMRLWPDGTFVDFDHGISSAVNKLRTALNDSAAHPHFIETVGRRGYRMIYPVTRVTPPPPALPIVEEPQRVPLLPPTPRRWPLIALAVAFLITAGILIAPRLLHRQTASTKPPVRSIAVLPLKNLSSDPEQEYFSEGLTDELITRLASLENLRVISRTSSMQYANTTKALPQIAQELHVDAIVEGSVLRSGDRVRITAQLIEASSDRHIWAQSYERNQRDIFALQNDVTRDIANNIMLRLEPADRIRLARSRPIVPAAHEAYLRGLQAFEKRGEVNIRQAVTYFQEAVAQDPSYALAYAQLADCYALLGGYSMLPDVRDIEKARAAANQAIALDSTLAEAHLPLALIAQNYDMDWGEAERHYRRALELDPKEPTAHHWYAEFLAFQGRFPEAFQHIERARELDPSSLILLTDRAVIYAYARDYDESLRQFREVLARDPKFPRTSLIIIPLVAKKQYAEALQILHAQDPDHRLGFTHAARAYVMGLSGDRKGARHELNQLLALHNIKAMDASALLYAYIGLGDTDSSFALLERAFAQHSTTLSSLKVNPAYDSLRGDPRFEQLLRRAHFE